MIFDGPIPFDEFVTSIASKLHRVPRYQQVVVMPPLNIGLPTWEDDPHFDIRRHVFRAALKPPGGEAELEALVGGIFSQRLDRSKPLWEIHVVHGLKDGRGALIWRLHHSLADGVSGTRTLELLLDPTPEGSPALSKPCPPLPKSSNSAPVDNISGIVHNTLDRLIATESGLLGFAQAVLGDPKQKGSKGLFSFLPELLVSVERLPFNKPCGEGRKFCWAEFDMAEVKAIREALGGRVNDVILTMLTRALACYVKLHGQSIMKRFVRIVCPVSLRKPGQEESLGNQISFMPVALPMDVQDPAEMLRAIAATHGNHEAFRGRRYGWACGGLHRQGPTRVAGALLVGASGAHSAGAALQPDLHECAGPAHTSLCGGKTDDCGVSPGADGLRLGRQRCSGEL